MPDSTILSTYAGTYEGWLSFSPQESNFIGRDVRSGDHFTLRYISGSLFQIDNDAQVEFEKGQGGAVTAIRLYWVNGMQEVIQKDK
jgi:hypothetical protein